MKDVGFPCRRQERQGSAQGVGTAGPPLADGLWLLPEKQQVRSQFSTRMC